MAIPERVVVLVGRYAVINLYKLWVSNSSHIKVRTLGNREDWIDSSRKERKRSMSEPCYKALGVRSDRFAVSRMPDCFLVVWLS